MSGPKDPDAPSVEPWQEAVAVLPYPLPIQAVHGEHAPIAGAAFALRIKDGILNVMFIDEIGRVMMVPPSCVRVVPQPGSDLAMAIGWAVTASPSGWKSHAARKRDGELGAAQGVTQ